MTSNVTASMWCEDCTRGYQLDGSAPRYYCPDCGGRTRPKQTASAVDE
jgi:Zn finger protein HypA/HybF involved in hydrogenase expression